MTIIGINLLLKKILTWLSKESDAFYETNTELNLNYLPKTNSKLYITHLKSLNRMLTNSRLHLLQQRRARKLWH